VPPSPVNKIYDAFLSYNTGADGSFAVHIQRALHRIAKPWYRLRTMRVFLDTSGLAATPDLFHELKETIDRSRFFILLLSPESVKSPWVDREVAYWLSKNSVQSIVLVVTHWIDGESLGTYPWRSGGVPPSLAGAFEAEPKPVDMRSWAGRTAPDPNSSEFRRAIAEIAAPILGRRKDDIVGEDLVQHRRTRSIAAAAIVALIVLALASATGAILALRNAKIANQRARIAVSRQLASEANYHRSARPDLSLLLASQGYSLSPTAESQAALFASLNSYAYLKRYFTVADSVTIRDACLSQSSAAAATDRGTIEFWDVKTGAHLRTICSGPATALCFSPDGRMLAWAGDTKQGSTVVLWDVVQGAEVSTFSKHQTSVSHIRFTRNNELVVTSDRRGVVYEWETVSGKAVCGPLSCQAISQVPNPDGSLIAGEQVGEVLAIWSSPSGALTAKLFPLGRRAERSTGAALAREFFMGWNKKPHIVNYCYSENGSRLMVLGSNHQLVTYNAATWREEARVAFAAQTPSAEIHYLDLARTYFEDKQRGLSCIFDLEHSRFLSPWFSLPENASLTASAGNYALALQGIGSQRIILFGFDAASPVSHVVSGLHANPLRSVQLSDDGRLAAFIDTNENLFVRSIARNDSVAGPLNAPAAGTSTPARDADEFIEQIRFSSDNSLLGAISSYGRIAVWSLSDSRKVFPPPNLFDRTRVLSFAIAPDQRRIALLCTDTSGSSDSLVQSSPSYALSMYDLQSGAHMAGPVTVGSEPGNFDMAFSPDGGLLAIAQPGAISLWNVAGNCFRPERLPHLSLSLSIAFSADGRRLASNGGRTIKTVPATSRNYPYFPATFPFIHKRLPDIRQFGNRLDHQAIAELLAPLPHS